MKEDQSNIFKNDSTILLQDDLIDKEIDNNIIVEDSNNIIEDNKCKHNIRISNLCADCGEIIYNDMEKLTTPEHTTDEIFQVLEEAMISHKSMAEGIHKNKKMILILDLDQTLIHATESVIGDPSSNLIKSDIKFTLKNKIYFVKLRPYTHSFLRHMYKYFQMHVYTMGTREYASNIIKSIDPDNKYFEDRVVTRTENRNELVKSIKRITSFSKNVLIVDDRLDVWSFIKNCIIIRPFKYYSKNLNECNNYNINKEISKIIKQEKSIKCNKNKDHITSNKISSDNISSNKISSNKISSNNFFKKKDKELKKLHIYLKQLHSKFFLNMEELSETKDASELGKNNNILKKYSFICNKNVSVYICFLGGKCINHYTLKDLKDLSSIICIENDNISAKYKLLNISSEWISECLYKRKRVDYNKFIIKDYREIKR